MKALTRFAVCLLSLVVAVGCASTETSNRQILVDEQIPRPDTIWVYDFAATSAEVPADSVLAGEHSDHPTPQSPQQIEAGRQLGVQIAQHLAEEIGVMGMPAKRAMSGTTPQINDIVIRGYLLAIDEGSAVKRVAIGFGSGGSELTVAAEGFQMTAQGLRKLGSGTVHSGGSQTPGAAVGTVALIATANPVGLIVSTGMKGYGEYSGSAKIEGRAKATAEEIADKIKPRFQQQGWIK